ncbi:MAG: hypothetical protein ACLPY1_12620 [Terracidiphilus sp.]
MKPRTRNFALIAVSALLSITSPHAMAQSGNFIVAQHGKPVGTATATFTANASGYDTTTVVKVAMPGLNYNLSKTEKLTSTNKIRQVQLSATVNNSAVNLTAAPDAGQILLSVSANGRSTTARFAMHPGAVFFPDFDPGAFDTLLALAVKQNNRGLWAIIPKQVGAQAGSIVPVLLATYADLDGTLDGKPITVHHLEATIGSAKSQIFSGPQNQLLQAELPQQGFALVRKGFVLTPPAKAGAPPEAPQAAPATPPTPLQQ